MDGNDSPLGGPLELPDDESRPERSSAIRRRRPKKKVVFILIGLLLVAGLGFGGWKLFSKKPVVQDTPNTPAAAPSPTTTSDVPQSSDMKTYKGDMPRIEFTYPASWTVTSKEGGVRIESPSFSYQTVAAGAVNGNFRIYIRQGARAADSKYIGRGTAIKPSEKLAYAHPALGQRVDTNLSSFGIDTPDHFAYFFIAGNYALKKGDTLGPGYGKEADTYIIAGGYSSAALTDDLATNKVPLDFYDQTNVYKQALEIIKSLKLL